MGNRARTCSVSISQQTADSRQLHTYDETGYVITRAPIHTLGAQFDIYIYVRCTILVSCNTTNVIIIYSIYVMWRRQKPVSMPAMPKCAAKQHWSIIWKKQIEGEKRRKKWYEYIAQDMCESRIFDDMKRIEKKMLSEFTRVKKKSKIIELTDKNFPMILFHFDLRIFPQFCSANCEHHVFIFFQYTANIQNPCTFFDVSNEKKNK